MEPLVTKKGQEHGQGGLHGTLDWRISVDGHLYTQRADTYANAIFGVLRRHETNKSLPIPTHIEVIGFRKHLLRKTAWHAPEPGVHR